MPPKARTIRARALRQLATDAEKRLWRKLREARLPWKFRRQHPVGRFAVDFAVVSEKLAIEIDGGQHGRAQDAARTKALDDLGWQIIRYWNHDVLGDAGSVIDDIARQLQQRANHLPCPLPPSGGGARSVDDRAGAAKTSKDVT